VSVAVVVLAVVSTGLVAGHDAVSLAAPVTTTAVSEPLEAADERSASLLAYRRGRPVTVTSLTTETSLTEALPDGTFRATLHMAPERMRDDAGAWVDVDLTLERGPDGGVAPRAHPGGLWLSGARGADSDAFVSTGRGQERTALGWRGVLPEPVLEGTKATYLEVKPGIDLVVEAQRTGFEYFLSVKNRNAAASVALVSMPWDTASLTPASRPGGGLELRSGQEAVVEVPPALMWDANMSPSGDPVRTAEVELSTTGSGDGTELVVEPDRAFMSDPATAYPVTIDPSVNLEPAFDAYVQDTIINTDKSGDTQLRLGFVDDADEGCASGCTARSFLSFHNLSGYWDARVVSAELLLWNSWSYSCRAAQWEAWRVDYVNSTVRWGSQPGWIENIGTSTGTKGYSGCADGRVSVPVAEAFRESFTNHWNTANIGLRATSESNHDGWKKFNSAEAADHGPYVVLVYNRRPGVPTALAVDSCYSACASPAMVRSGQPQISALVSDPDGGTLRVEYEVWDNAKTTRKAASGTAVTGVASGTRRPWRVSVNLPDDQTYHFRVRACDVYDCSVSWSGWFTFTVDTDAPGLPGVTSEVYKEKSTGTWNGHPGVAGDFTFAPNGATDLQEYIYSLNGGESVTVPVGTPQAEKLSANQRLVSTDVSGFTAGANATIWRSPNIGHNSSDSLKVTVAATAGTGDGPGGDTYATVGGDYGGMRLGMQPGRKYLVTGWLWVPAATGLNPGGAYGSTRGQRIVVFYNSGSSYASFVSPKATMTEQWQFLSVAVTIPSNATEAFVRLYNGSPTGSAKFVYWDDLSVRELTGTSTVTPIVPPRDGQNVLEVRSRNTVGFTSDPKVYQFLVSPSTNSWYWPMDEGVGSTAASVPDTRPAGFSAAGVGWTGPRVGSSAVALDGTGDLATASPVLDTADAAGFTVAAYARPTDLAGNRTVVSQSGATRSMFRLGLRTDVDVDGNGQNDAAWCFSVTQADTAAAGVDAACTTHFVQVNDWVSLVGIYDPVNGLLKLYVNGTPDWGGTYVQAGLTSAPWTATNPFRIGRAIWADYWIGDLDQVNASQYMWTNNDIVSFNLQ
jgi:hypothetical protein